MSHHRKNDWDTIRRAIESIGGRVSEDQWQMSLYAPHHAKFAYNKHNKFIVNKRHDNLESVKHLLRDGLIIVTEHYEPINFK
jgi:hypothetical protein